MTLLLIEDDTEAAEYLIKGLQDSGYSVDHAAEGREGLSKATAGRYEVIVADRHLPHLDGLSIISALRQNATVEAGAICSGGITDATSKPLDLPTTG